MKFDLQGVLNNFASTRLGPAARAFARLHVKVHGTPVGKMFDRYFGAPVFEMTVRGRKTGELRTVMLILTRRGDDIVVAGSNAGNEAEPNWFRNLRAAGEATVKVAGQAWPVTFRVVEGAEREECWRLVNATYPSFSTYQERSTREIPVAVLERR
ncbi:MAG: nitroreductase family deazaflavin-dependent oxidoreductase [Nocardiaceae bacterium]|nr:nitroreductase family deazaflavin-dependent oxidoreductase [Nocardiaceae bacterium]